VPCAARRKKKSFFESKVVKNCHPAAFPFFVFAGRLDPGGPWKKEKSDVPNLKNQKETPRKRKRKCPWLVANQPRVTAPI
jgi:hypothetical protein